MLVDHSWLNISKTRLISVLASSQMLALCLYLHQKKFGWIRSSSFFFKLIFWCSNHHEIARSIFFSSWSDIRSDFCRRVRQSDNCFWTWSPSCFGPVCFCLIRWKWVSRNGCRIVCVRREVSTQKTALFVKVSRVAEKVPFSTSCHWEPRRARTRTTFLETESPAFIKDLIKSAAWGLTFSDGCRIRFSRPKWSEHFSRGPVRVIT